MSVIRVENLSKRFQLGDSGGQRNFREVLSQSLNPFMHQKSSSKEDFWALRNINFELQQGDVVGVIGRNGAGKSTLLKILSRITEPTSGRATIRGRIGSLLEVGTGFHPELSGRENIFLNGAILGMKRSEIRAKFDEIVAFAEVERFIDTPVKHYSSGMYVRLAFAVAAHLEPEILIVDEVLAVGDAAFQKKCLGKMGDVAKQGRTILFVSHNMPAVRSLCPQAMLLDHGQMGFFGSAKDAIQKYFDVHTNEDSQMIWTQENAPRTKSVYFLRAYISTDGQNVRSTIDYSEAFIVVLEIAVEQRCHNLRLGFTVSSSDDVVICGSNYIIASSEAALQSGSYRIQCTFPKAILNTGTYLISFGADAPHAEGMLIEPFPCLRFDIEDSVGHGAIYDELPGLVRLQLPWTSHHLSS